MLFLNELFLDDTLGTNLLKWAGSIGGALVAMFLIFSLVKDAFSYVKGSGQVSIGKIVSKIIVLIICIGLVALAASGGLETFGKSLANFFTGLFKKAVDDSGVGGLDSSTLG